MNDAAQGIYFDGRVARGHVVTLHFTEPGLLRVSGDGIALEHELARIGVSDRLGDVPRFLYLPEDAVIETSANDVVDAALAARRQSRGAHLIHVLESQQRIAAAACVLLVAALVALGVWGPPLLARVVAQRVPPEIDRRIGDASLVAMRRYVQPSNLTLAERARVHVQLTRLQADPAVPRPRVEFYSMNGLPNAFALPGNVIIVTDELVRLPAGDDELAAVLAHELGHLALRHGLQGILRQSFALLVVAAVTGDVSALTSFASTVPLTLLTAGYARDLEREADRYALALLRRRDIKPQAFSTVLLKLEQAHAGRARNAHYLSTHPATEERTAIFGGLTPAERNAVIAEPFLQRGTEASARRDHTSAIEHFTRFLELNPTAHGHVLRAKSHLARDDRAAAEQDVAAALKLDPDSTEVLPLHAELLALHQQKFPEAIIAAKAALAANPDDPNTLAILGYAETVTGERTAAAKHLERALALSRNHAFALGFRGYLRLMQGNPASALPDFDAALRQQPRNEWVLFNRGIARVQLGRASDALADFTAVRDVTRHTGDYHFYRACAEHSLQQTENALADYTLALKKGCSISRSIVLTNRGGTNRTLGRIEAALTDFDEAIALDGKNGQAFLQRADAHNHVGKHDAALADLERALACGINEAVVGVQRGNFLRQAGDFASSLRSLDQAVEQKPDAQAYRSRGLTHFALGDFARAELDFAEAVKKGRAPIEDYSNFFLLLCRRRLGHNEQRSAFAVQVASMPGGWGKSVGRYLAGDASETQLLAATGLGQNPTREERRCEAYFYIAETYLHDGNRTMAESFYQQCVDTGVTHYSEHTFARAELKRMREKP